MKRRRRLLFAVLVLAAVIGALAVAVKGYLRSRHVADQVAARLEEVYGAPVEIGELDVGLRESTLRGLKLYEPDADPPGDPWLTVDRVTTDVSIWDLFRRQATPRFVTLTGVKAVVRADWLDRLRNRPKGAARPRPLPTLRIEGGQLTVRQQGRADFTVARV